MSMKNLRSGEDRGEGIWPRKGEIQPTEKEIDDLIWETAQQYKKYREIAEQVDLVATLKEIRSEKPLPPPRWDYVLNSNRKVISGE